MPNTSLLVNKSQITAILNKIISKTLTKSYPMQTPLLDKITKNTKGARFDFENDTIYFDMSTQPLRPAGTSITGQLPARSLNMQAFSQTAVPYYVSAQVPKFTQALARNDRGAIARLVPELITGFRDGFALKWNKDLNGDGTGLLAKVGANTTSSTSLTVTNDTDIEGSRYFDINMPITIVGATGGSLGATGTIVTAVDYVNNTLTLKDNMTTTAGADIYEIGPDGAAVSNIQGLGTLIADTGTVQGLNIDGVRGQQSVIYNSAATFNGNILVHLYNQIRFDKPDFISTNQTGYNKIADSLVGQLRGEMGDKSWLDLGYENVTIMGGRAKLVLDYDAPYDHIRGINTKYLKWGEMQKFGPMDPTVSIRIPTYAVSEFAMQWSGNVINTLLGSALDYTAWT